MDWMQVARAVAPLAPTLGGLLGGFIPFPGGSLIGQTIGNVIAKQLGVEPTPTAVNDALARMTHEEKLAAMQAATERARIEVAGFVEAEKQYFETVRVAVAETGATMRAEILPENRHWFYTGWRPAAGWTFVLYSIIFGGVLMAAGIASGFYNKPQALDRLTAAWPIYAAYFGTLAAMVGVYVIGRSNEKIAKVDPPPAPVKKK